MAVTLEKLSVKQLYKSVADLMHERDELQRQHDDLVIKSATVISDLQRKADALAAEKYRHQNSEATETLQKICNIFRIGIQAQTQSTILVNVENAVRFADQLHAIEREFFMVPGEPDEDYPDDEPADVCLVNCWGSSTEQYVEQFRAALAGIRAQVWIEAKDFTKSMIACDSVDHIDLLFDGKVHQLRKGAGL